MNAAMNWSVVAPEILLLTMACVIAIVDLFVTDAERRVTFWLTQASLAVVALLHLRALDAAESVFAMQSMFVSDSLGHLLALFATLAVMVTVAYARPYIGPREMQKGEFYTLALFVLLAAVFFLAASAGLTVLSQAAAIVQAYGGAAAFAVGATTFVTGAVGAARIGGGWLVDHFAAARVGVGAHACSLAGAVLLMLNPTPPSAAFALGLIGIGYGIVSGLAAGAIAQYWHKNQFGHVAGRLYIAWCAAAVGLPVLAGALFDRTGSYASTVWVAAGINVLGMVVAGRLPAR